MKTRDIKQKDDPIGDAVALHNEQKQRSMVSLSKDLSGIAENLKVSALEWKDGDKDDMEKLFTDALEIPMAHYEIWLLGEKLYSVQASVVRNKILPNISSKSIGPTGDAALGLLMTGCLSPAIRTGTIFPFIQGKITAVLSILSELTGIPRGLVNRCGNESGGDPCFLLYSINEPRPTIDLRHQLRMFHTTKCALRDKQHLPDDGGRIGHFLEPLGGICAEAGGGKR